MIRHIVFFKYKADSSTEDRHAALEALRSLPSNIPVIKSYEVGENILSSARAWDAGLIGTYANLEDLQTYSDHPDHQAAAQKIRAVSDAIASVDYEI